MSRLPAITAGPRRRWLLALGANGLMQGLCAAASSLALGRLANDAALLPSAAVITTGAALLIVLKRVELDTAEQLGQDYAIDVRDRLYRRVLEDRAADGSTPRPAAVLLRFTTDLNGLRQWASQGLAVLIGDGALLLVVLAVLAAVAPLLAAIALGGSLLMLAVTLLLRRRLHAANQSLRQLRSRLSATVARRLHEAKPDNDVRRDCRRLRRRGEDVALVARDRARIQGTVRGAATAIGLVTVAAMVLAAHRLPGAVPTSGSVLVAIALGGLVAAPLRRMTRAFEIRQSHRVARQRIERLLRPDERLPTESPDVAESEPEKVSGNAGPLFPVA